MGRSAGFATAALAALAFVTGGASLGHAQQNTNIDIIPTITSLAIANGGLVASGTATAVVGNRTFTTTFSNVPVDLSLAADQTGAGACPILDLELGPIHLDLLGLVVDTSAICLRITAYEQGGLLGSLLCSVANLLQGGLSLDQILAGQGTLLLPGLTSAQLNSLLAGVTNLLNNALDNLLGAGVIAIIDANGRRYCDILNLSLGPVALNLLGLAVNLDNCQGGAVTVDVTGDRRGGLLGNLLCGLLDGGAISVGDTLSAVINQLLARLGV